MKKNLFKILIWVIILSIIGYLIYFFYKKYYISRNLSDLPTDDDNTQQMYKDVTGDMNTRLKKWDKGIIVRDLQNMINTIVNKLLTSTKINLSQSNRNQYTSYVRSLGLAKNNLSNIEQVPLSPDGYFGKNTETVVRRITGKNIASRVEVRNALYASMPELHSEMVRNNILIT